MFRTPPLLPPLPHFAPHPTAYSSFAIGEGVLLALPKLKLKATRGSGCVNFTAAQLRVIRGSTSGRVKVRGKVVHSCSSCFVCMDGVACFRHLGCLLTRSKFSFPAAPGLHHMSPRGRLRCRSGSEFSLSRFKLCHPHGVDLRNLRRLID